MLITETHPYHRMIRDLPGKWYYEDCNHLIRVTEAGQRYAAAIFEAENVLVGRRVFGTYPTAEDAVSAATDRIAIKEAK